ncbi:hypothetical protein SAMN04487944_1226 [Gracilibacillus ureilyticus]|uniref:STAS domain-containing protein n=1 Tax=Gracilibacillus ureilyticus TaxID=531814 RepID=A0A1H9V7N6_9BACI|nr:hypothetical protein [Gracilibacillus ureilyticus]SES17860.1 hypothetical protein SAMN04487944_1226 [Gracilibacillus ureilyticus]
MSKTTILVDPSKKVVNMAVAGKMTMEDAELFVKEYNAKIGPINGEEFELMVDCTEMKVLTPEMGANLEEVMKMYKNTGFKKITYMIKENNILKMQLTRISRNAGLQAISEVTEAAS